jgi:hypothetical protein
VGEHLSATRVIPSFTENDAAPWLDDVLFVAMIRIPSDTKLLLGDLDMRREGRERPHIVQRL